MRGRPTPSRAFCEKVGAARERFGVPGETDGTGLDLGFASQNRLEAHITITAAPSIESCLSAIKASLA
jgi:hypothetical protein